MSDIPIETIERWALAVHQWLADDDQHGEVIADAMVATRLDRAAVLAGSSISATRASGSSRWTTVDASRRA